MKRVGSLAPPPPSSATAGTIYRSPFGLSDSPSGPRDVTVRDFQARFGDLCAFRRPTRGDWIGYALFPLIAVILRLSHLLPMPPRAMDYPVSSPLAWVTVFDLAAALFLIATPFFLRRLNFGQCLWWLFGVPWFFLYFLDSDYFVGITVIVFTLSAFYLLSILARLGSVLLGMIFNPALRVTPAQTAALDPATLPRYTVLVPMFKEKDVAKTLLRAMSNLDYPQDRLEVIILLEEDDAETIEQFRQLKLPRCVEVLIVPKDERAPKGKPRACNHGLGKASGEFLVIYDAEDRPDPDQLKKAVAAFAHQPLSVICLQAKLNYFNPYQNLLTACFTIEYNTWYELFLPGLHVARAPIPLGGTSNHFRVGALRAVGGWDPYNVTEDCDLGLRLWRMGYSTKVLDSTTWEEGNSRLGNWMRQRSRWIKGYMQTHIVHSRDPLRSIAGLSPFRWLGRRPAALSAPVAAVAAIPGAEGAMGAMGAMDAKGASGSEGAMGAGAADVAASAATATPGGQPAASPPPREAGMGLYGYLWNLLSIGGLSAMLLMNLFFWVFGLAYLSRHQLADELKSPWMYDHVPHAREIQQFLDDDWALMYTRGTSEQNEGRTIYSGAPIAQIDRWSLISQLFFPGVVAMALANVVFVLFGALAVIKRRQWGLLLYVPLLPFYWILISLAAWKGAWQLAVNPFYWEKTTHALAPEAHAAEGGAA